MIVRSTAADTSAPHPNPLPANGEREGPAPKAWEGEGLRGGAARDPSDICAQDWVERWLPAWAEPYARLARLDRPIGTWLLLFPGWWGIALAAQRWPDPVLLALLSLYLELL